MTFRSPAGKVSACTSLARTSLARRSLARKSLAGATMLAGLLAGPALAADPDTCKTVRLSDVGWTDVTSTTALTARLLKGLGYTPDIKVLSVPVTFAAMKNKDIDVFMGNWMPTQGKDIKPYADDKSVLTIGANLPTGAKYTLSVPKYTYDAGLKTFADIAKFEKDLDGKIYGIEPGNDGNRLVMTMIKDDKFGLKGFQVVESSEQGMLSQVDRATRRHKPVVFLGWAPHPMNVKYQMEYLSGGDDVFGPNFGGAVVYTNERAGWAEQCPNAAKLVANMKFSVDQENLVMDKILNDGEDATKASDDWLKANPAAIEGWTAGVTTFDDKPGTAAVKASLGL